MFYLTTHSTHFYSRVYGVGHMVLDHSDRERGNPLPSPHGILFPIKSNGSCICTNPTDWIAHTPVLDVTPVVENWLEREIAQWVYHEGSIRQPIAPWANALTTGLHLAPEIHRD